MNNSESWLEKYRPKKFTDYLGNKSHIKEIKEWIQNFENKNNDKYFLLLHGIPGVGKTTLAYLIFRAYNYEIIEINTSEHRTRKNVHNKIGCLNHNTVISKEEIVNGKKQISFLKTGLLMDEIDGITTYAESSGIQELQNIVLKNKQSNRYPIICTCNSMKNKKLKELEKHSISIKLEKPKLNNLLKLANKIMKEENFTLDQNVLNNLVKNCLEYRELINKLYQLYLDIFKTQKVTRSSLTKNKTKSNTKSNIKSKIESNINTLDINNNFFSNINSELNYTDNVASKIKYILLNDSNFETISSQVEESSNVFILNIYINSIKILNILENSNKSLAKNKDNFINIIKIVTNRLVSIDKYHNQLFINHYWDLNNYMVYELINIIYLYKINNKFFDNTSKSLKFSNQNFILDHHNNFNQMSQNQSNIKKRKRKMNLDYDINDIQSFYYCSLIHKTKNKNNNNNKNKNKNNTKNKNKNNTKNKKKLVDKITKLKQKELKKIKAEFIQNLNKCSDKIEELFK